MKGPAAILSFIVGKIRTEDDGVLTHLQKYSPLGFMLTYPLCLHLWLFWKKQDGNDAEGWTPGTESGFYTRFQPLALLPLILAHWIHIGRFHWTLIWGLTILIQWLVPAYRYDHELGMKKTAGYVGGHWD